MAVLVAVRLLARLRDAHAEKRREKLTLRFVAITFFALAAMTKRVGIQLGDKLMLADVAGTRICGLLSVSTLIALIVFAATGASWLHPNAGFLIALFAINEGLEAREGGLEHDHPEP